MAQLLPKSNQLEILIVLTYMRTNTLLSSKQFWLSVDEYRVYPQKIIFDHVTLIKVKNKHEKFFPA